ncbi:MAG TPA: Uma2 family endonuclease, partial [Chloroflexota bacterium]
MHAEIAELDWPADLLDDEEQDEPLAGQDHHDTIDNLHYPLRTRLSGPACFVAAELRVHRNPRNLRDYQEPDILVAFGVPDRTRRRYLLWEERKAPDLVVEILSPSSLKNGDLTKKRDWYQAEGVREYVVLDPSGDFAPEPRMQVWRFADLASPGSGGAEHVVPAEGTTLASVLIPFGWRIHEGVARAVDLHTNEVFPILWDLEPQLRAEIRTRRAAETEARLAREEAWLAE